MLGLMTTQLSAVDKDSFLTQVETARGRLRESVSELRVSLQQREEELCGVR